MFIVYTCESETEKYERKWKINECNLTTTKVVVEESGTSSITYLEKITGYRKKWKKKAYVT